MIKKKNVSEDFYVV